MPPLHAMRAFEAAARMLSISRAAAELHVTAGAVSRQVRGLEHQLGVPLFIRGHRSMTLTAAGALYAAELTGLFGRLHEVTQNVSAIRAPDALRIGVAPTFAQRWLIPRIPPFHRAEPGIEVQIRAVGPHPDWRDLDAAILFGDGKWPGCRAVALVDNVITPVCSAAFLAGAGHLQAPADICGKTLLYSLTRPEDWSSWLAAAGIDPPLTLAARRLGYESSSLAYQAALHGIGIAIAQLALVEDDLQEGRLVAPFGQRLDMHAGTYYFVTPARKKPAVPLRRFGDWLAGAAHGIGYGLSDIGPKETAPRRRR